MQMPNSYNETKAGGDFTPISLGGHHLIIKKVFEKSSVDVEIWRYDLG